MEDTPNWQNTDALARLLYETRLAHRDALSLPVSTLTWDDLDSYEVEVYLKMAEAAYRLIAEQMKNG